MKKRILFITIALAIASVAWGLSGLQKDSAYNVIQGFAPDPTKDTHISNNAARTVDASDDMAWQINTSAATCVYQNHSTATVTGIKKPILSGIYDGRIVRHKKHGVSFGNHSTAFLTFTNCTSATLERM